MNKIIILVVSLFTTNMAVAQCACCAGAGMGSSNGDYNNGILTLPKKMLVAEAYADYRYIKMGSAETDDEALLRSMFITSAGLRYGITDRLTISTLLPMVSLYTNTGNDGGIGDLIVLGTYRLIQKNNFNVAVQGGLELPTGIRKNSNFDNTTVIIGSGSVDPMIGLVFSKKFDYFTLNGNAMYKHTTSGFNGNYYGSLAIQNLNLSYKIFGDSKFCSVNETENNTNFALSIFGGYYGEWLDKLSENNETDDNSGHYLGFASWGANLNFKQWAFPLTISLPIINNVYGNQNQAGYRLRLGIIKSF